MKKGSALILVATVACTLACAGGPRRVAAPTDGLPVASEGAAIEAIVPSVSPERTRVVLEGNSPVLYTSYQPDARTLVIEIQGVDTSKLPPVVEIGGNAVGEVQLTTEERKAGVLARFSFRDVWAETSLRSEGSDLIIDFVPLADVPVDLLAAARKQPEPAPAPAPSPVVEEEPIPVPDAAAAEPAPAEETPVAAPAPRPLPPAEPASRLLALRPSATAGGVRVSLEADGALTYRVFSLQNPDRLVLDLIGVRNTLGTRHVPVEAAPVEQVRVAQFRDEPEPVARVVLDLRASAPYEVIEGRDTLEVVIGERAVAALAVPADPAASAPVEPSVEVAAVEVATAATPAGPVPAPTLEVETVELPVADPYAEVASVPLKLEDLDLAPADEEDFVLFDQAAASPEETLRRTVPSYFQATTIAGEQKIYTGEKISVNFVGADLKNVFLFFADFIGLNIVLDEEISGTLTMRLNQVPWDQAFDVILRHKGLEKVVEGDVVRIATTEKLRSEASQRQALKAAQEAEVDPITFTKVLSYAKVDEVGPLLLQGVKSDRGKVVQDARTNTLIITDVPDKRDAYQKLIDVLDTRTEQVMIEARIVETDRNFEHNLGIQWTLTGRADPALGTQTNFDFPHRANMVYDVNLPAPASVSTLGLSLGNVLDSVTLDIALQAFENEGKVRILSSPKIATQNNQSATIEQGTQIPVVTTTAVEIDVQYISASLKLQVTPQITAEGTVIMDVDVENNSPDFTNRVGDVPPILTERATTQILIRDGGTAVIGGIFRLQESRAEAGVPGMKNIPGLGWLFKNRAITKQNTELLVFITPRILKDTL